MIVLTRTLVVGILGCIQRTMMYAGTWFTRNREVLTTEN
jgi:hypothetical protein